MTDTPDRSDLIKLDQDEIDRLYSKDRQDHIGFAKDHKSIEKLSKRLGIIYNYSSLDDLRRDAPNMFSVYVLKNYLADMGMSIDDFYQFNSNGFRCDEFTTEHDGLHVLFAGCSITFGDSILLEDVWAHKVYQEISKDEKTSGYFNIGSPGASVASTIQLIIRYIVKYGIPDIIFINFPDEARDLVDSTSTNYIGEETNLKITKLTYSLYESLKILLDNNGSKIYPFSWDKKINHPSHRNIDVRNLIDIYKYKVADAERHIFKYINDNKGHRLSKFMIKALDDAHPGIAIHDFYAKFAYNLYKGDKK